MKMRIIFGLALLPLIGIVLVGGIPLLILAAAVGLIGLYEFYSGWENTGVKPSMVMGYGLTISLYIMHILYNHTSIPMPRYDLMLMLWLFCAVIGGLLMVLRLNKFGPGDGPTTIFGVLYVGYFSYHAVLIEQLPAGSLFMPTIMITSFATDIGAYFTGFLLGKRKLAPKLSPKKTVEGSVGGLLASILLCGLYSYIRVPEYLVHFLMIGFSGSVAAQIGDLVASAFKRRMGIKDFGNLIPGHGGVLDRFDSILFTAPFTYYYLLIFVTPPLWAL